MGSRGHSGPGAGAAASQQVGSVRCQLQTPRRTPEAAAGEWEFEQLVLDVRGLLLDMQGVLARRTFGPYGAGYIMRWVWLEAWYAWETFQTLGLG